MITQLNPSLPVIVTSKLDEHGKPREGEAIAVERRSIEHHLYWIVVFDDTGEIWTVPNPEVRVTRCWTTERPPRKVAHAGQPCVPPSKHKPGCICVECEQKREITCM